MTMLKKLLVLVAVGTLSVPALASDNAKAAAEQVIALKDGATLYVFKDGKMAMEDAIGRAVRMTEGAVMETREGQKFTMNGDEVARLSALLAKGHEK